MWGNILKKDWKRKSISNLILLIIIIIVTTLVCSSVYNIKVISESTKSYIEDALIGDFYIETELEEGNSKKIRDFLESNEYVKYWTNKEFLEIEAENLRQSDGSLINMNYYSNLTYLPIQNRKIYDNNKEIIKVPEGKIYLSYQLMVQNSIKEGDYIFINVGNYNKKFEVIGNAKDSIYGADGQPNHSMFIAQKDYNDIAKEKLLKIKEDFVVGTTNLEKFINKLIKIAPQESCFYDKEYITKFYMMDLVLSIILITLSLGLILVSWLILRFSINFSIVEEFREIGVMKAIGIKSSSIRFYYLFKYLVLAILGCVIGIFTSYPVGDILLKETARNMVIHSEYLSGLYLRVISAILVVVLVVYFAYLNTRKIKNITPVEAIREGKGGERFNRISHFYLHNSYFKVPYFLAFNDIRSDFKRYVSLGVIFTIGIMMMIVPINAINTLVNDSNVNSMGLIKSDLYLYPNAEEGKNFKNISKVDLEKYIEAMKINLAKNNIKANVWVDILSRYYIEFKDKYYSTDSLQGIGISAEQYAYIEGNGPRYENEVAITSLISKLIGAKIGDEITINTLSQNEEYIVTGIFERSLDLGEGIRFSQQNVLKYDVSNLDTGIQIAYTDEVSTVEATNRMEIVQKLYPQFKVYNNRGFIDLILESFIDRIQPVINEIILVILSLDILVTTLMLSSFIARDKKQIALMKSMGFNNMSIIMWQISRIGIVILSSIIIGTLLAQAIGPMTLGKAFIIMGYNKVKFVINPVEIYLMYPAIVLVITLLASFFTALQVRNICTREINSME